MRSLLVGILVVCAPSLSIAAGKPDWSGCPDAAKAQAQYERCLRPANAQEDIAITSARGDQQCTSLVRHLYCKAPVAAK